MKLAPCTALACALILPASASAAQFNIVFSGTVNDIFLGNAPSLTLDDVPFAAGDAWELGFVLDTEAANTTPFPDIATYQLASGFTGTVGGYSLTTPDGMVSLNNDLGPDNLDFVVAQWRAPSFLDVFDFELSLVEFQRSDSNLFDTLPTLTPELFSEDVLNDWTITIAFRDSSLFEFYNARLNPLTVEATLVSQVPAPGALVLLASALLVTVQRRSRVVRPASA